MNITTERRQIIYYNNSHILYYNISQNVIHSCKQTNSQTYQHTGRQADGLTDTHTHQGLYNYVCETNTVAHKTSEEFQCIQQDYVNNSFLTVFYLIFTTQFCSVFCQIPSLSVALFIAQNAVALTKCLRRLLACESVYAT